MRRDFTPDQKKQIYACYHALMDKKAEEVLVLDLRGISSVADFFVICHGGSQRQVQAISDNVEQAFRSGGVKDYRVEGRETGTWVLMDFHDIVVHVFYHTARAFYALENLWSDARTLEGREIQAWG